MKELKFRVWDIELECYLDESELAGITPDGKYILYIEEDEISRLEIEENYIVEQYTGLKDRNGKEVYEGDLVANGTLTGVVEYKVDDFCAWTVRTTTNGVVLLSGSWTVIGNVHEAELLKNLDSRSLG